MQQESMSLTRSRMKLKVQSLKLCLTNYLEMNLKNSNKPLKSRCNQKSHRKKRIATKSSFRRSSHCLHQNLMFQWAIKKRIQPKCLELRGMWQCLLRAFSQSPPRGKTWSELWHSQRMMNLPWSLYRLPQTWELRRFPFLLSLPSRSRKWLVRLYLQSLAPMLLQPLFKSWKVSNFWLQVISFVGLSTKELMIQLGSIATIGWMTSPILNVKFTLVFLLPFWQ